MPNGHRINMGAYGGTRQASKSRRHCMIADLDSDGIVNLRDLMVFYQQWLGQEEWVE